MPAIGATFARKYSLATPSIQNKRLALWRRPYVGFNVVVAKSYVAVYRYVPHRRSYPYK